MTYIKRVVMHGFKSFAKKTEIPFTQGINCILGPNGSGKSNISDALCFVLGRLSAKSMRAAKSGNLIFMGSKAAPPMKEAWVEIVFDNSDRTFSLESNEISIKRIVRKNGQSIYKINHETKTRQDVLTLLAQAGIDPNGFNIILQNEIRDFTRMQGEERRKIIEEVAGISIYEVRKEKSLKELEKTEEKLKEIMTTLRERTAYLNNLEKERQQALRFRKLEAEIKQLQASIIFCNLSKKKKDLEKVNEELAKKEMECDKIRKYILKLKNEIETINNKIEEINSTIQKSTGLEQEKLNREISDLRASREGLRVRLENSERKIAEIQAQMIDREESIRNNELIIKELQKDSPNINKKTKDIESKKKELEKLENERKKFYITKSELRGIIERIEDKKTILQGYNNESNYIIKDIENSTISLFDKKTDIEKLNELKMHLEDRKNILQRLDIREREIEKLTYNYEREIENQNKIIENLAKINGTCPLCKSKITDEHIKNIKNEINPRLIKIKSEIENCDKELNEIYKKRKEITENIEKTKDELSRRQNDLIKIGEINNKKEQIKLLQIKIDNLNKEIEILLKRKKNLEENFDENSTIDHRYDTLRIELQELSMRTEESVNSDISFKQITLEREKAELNQLKRAEQELEDEISETKKKINFIDESLETKKRQDGELSRKFQKLLEEKNNLSRKIKDYEIEALNAQNNLRGIEQLSGDFKIEKARVDAEIQNLETEIMEFQDIEIIKSNRDSLIEKLNNAKDTISKIGSVNLRSLEVYEEIKKEYDKITEKADIINKEKESIMNIIHNIDIKKKKTFLRTFIELNDIFSRNFSQLSAKGQVDLELENKKEPFEGGVGITVKMGHGKYFDVTSLSGGEQTLVALALIFAIQELKPYYFYILDEIDAALDKMNSERLAGLLKKYMQKGQYIVVTHHNDEVIRNATNLYGVSMYEGISKVVSLKV